MLILIILGIAPTEVSWNNAKALEPDDEPAKTRYFYLPLISQ